MNGTARWWWTLGALLVASCGAGTAEVAGVGDGPGSDTGLEADADADADTDADTDADADADADVNPLIGLVFVQDGRVGLASYHFDAEDDVYISYEAFDVVMDNGRLAPDEKPFVDTAFELDDRTFRATIDWSDPEGTTVGGAERWVYEMVFDADYQRIDGGSVVAYSSGGTAFAEYDFGSDLVYVRAD